ncbi:NUDIX hydrolase, partial [Aeromonas veronii]|uniref:NUDIX hydrolase n=1 Tax=Aeromonas veronii TaxID=654 RepID=UPI00214EC99D
VEQYRWPLRANTIELPAGIIGDSEAFADEDAATSALRELEEETGFRGRDARLIFTAPTAGGLTAEQSYFVRVTGLTRVSAGGGVDDE